MDQSSYGVNRLAGKVAIVTASTEGIGFGIAKRFALEGAKVVVSSRRQSNVDRAILRLAQDGLGERVVGVVCHVAKAEDRRRIFDEAVKLGGPHILVSNASVYPGNWRISECPESVWDKVFEVNVKAAFLLAKEVYPLMQKNGGGRIIFISSVGAYLPLPILGAYTTSKVTLLGLTKELAGEIACENITVNCISPGYIPTGSSERVSQQQKARNVLEAIPLNRYGTPDDIAGVAAFLASDDSSYVTGETIVVAGGLHSRL
ncbi:hypothetical protein PPYR_10354 [Photinus pyralis]|uniref:Dehydrogenase/reductase SDR family member 4 n=1 Tax=Photinus pyralis TaxID=7054 RepID=A0A5N4AG64_PHOPY|nr:dehydrogenase/reductase SDR family member 4-like [Photinus pyralis]KAB0796293.1 hypothetical protein PPYR_10354 [Photinus pyralis]